MCKKSESIKNIAVALAKFNGEVSKIEKDSANPHFKNKYASLDNIIDEIRPILQRNGLSIIQMPGGDGEKFTMTTMLIHESGEWIESDPIVMRPVKNDPQGIGSCATYARRYSLAAFLSLNTGEDDDGNGASLTPQPKQDAPKPPESAPAASNLASEGQVKMLNAKASGAGYKAADKLDLMEAVSQLIGRKIDSLSKVEKSEVNKVAQWLDSQKAAS